MEPIERYLAWLSRIERAPTTVRAYAHDGYKPFLHGIASSRPRGRVGRLRQQRRTPATLTVEQVAAILAAQTRLRDRLLFALPAGTGMRIGQALGLRHSDVVSQQRRIAIVAREDNANGARGKGSHGWVPITSELVRLQRGEIPKVREALPRFVDEFVMGQLDTEDALDRLPDLTTRTAVLILIETAFAPSTACGCRSIRSPPTRPAPPI